MGILDDYAPPADIPGYDLDPRELERLRSLGLMRFGLGLAGREPIGSALTAGINTTMEGQVNARREMLARLQAYSEAQKIRAKQQELAQQAAIQKETSAIPPVGAPNLPAMQPGGPTPANAQLAAPITQYQRLLQTAEIFRARGMSEEAKRFYDAAKDIRAKYFAPVPARDAKGNLVFTQFSENEDPKIAQGVTPPEKMVPHDVGGDVHLFGEHGTRGEILPKTMTYADRAAAAQVQIARERLNWDKQGESPAEKTAFANANTLRDEFNTRAAPFIAVRDGQRRVLSAYESAKTDKSGAADMALIYGYMKVLDPGTGVKEGEYATAQNAGSIPDWVRAKYNAAITGQKLSDDVRNKIVKASVGLYQKADVAHRNTEAQYEGLAKRYKLDPANVIVNYRLAGDEADPTLTDAQKKAAAIIERDRKR